MLLTPGYWPSTYWADSYWQVTYWPFYGLVAYVRRGIRNFGFSYREYWR